MQSAKAALAQNSKPDQQTIAQLEPAVDQTNANLPQVQVLAPIVRHGTAYRDCIEQ